MKAATIKKKKKKSKKQKTQNPKMAQKKAF